jgi:GTP-binding protein
MAADQDQSAHPGRRLFSMPCEFVASAPKPESLPAPSLPEVAFAGRSNAGKSSLINALVHRRNLARTSQTPGRTQAVNMFSLGGRLHLIDLPGYGYAKVGRTEVARWTATVDAYLAGRLTLRRVCLLMDARRGTTANDRTALDHMDLIGTPYQIVLTKADKLKKTELAAVMAGVHEEIAVRPAAYPQVIATSARTGAGMDELRDTLAALAVETPLA